MHLRQRLIPLTAIQDLPAESLRVAATSCDATYRFGKNTIAWATVQSALLDAQTHREVPKRRVTHGHVTVIIHRTCEHSAVWACALNIMAHHALRKEVTSWYLSRSDGFHSVKSKKSANMVFGHERSSFGFGFDNQKPNDSKRSLPTS